MLNGINTIKLVISSITGLLLNVWINRPDYSLDVHYELKVSPVDRCYLQKIRFHLILLRFLIMINEKSIT